MREHIVECALAVLALAWPLGASAHQGGIELSGLEIVANGANVEVWVHMHAHIFQPVAPMDDDKNGIINEAEAKTHITVWQGYIAQRLTLSVDGAPCVPTPGDHELAIWNQILHAQMRYACPQGWGTLEVDNRLLWEQPAKHRFLLSVLAGGEESNTMHDEKKRRSTFSLGPPPAGATPNPSVSAPSGNEGHDDSGLWSTLWLGMEHILYGLDHVVFVLLLLVATQSAGALLGQITAFTVSHSLTLLLAAYEVIVLPSWLVESVIAASILVVALDNIWRSRRDADPKGVWWQRSALAFGFGLVHGMGFASALGPLSSNVGLVWLLGFNLGVEVGQLVVVLGVWPLLRLGMKHAAYPTWLRGVSALCGLVAVWWLIERLQGA